MVGIGRHLVQNHIQVAALRPDQEDGLTEAK
jgi:hypothetical protein